MPTPPADDRCPLTAALDAIGGKWNLIALYFLSSGTRRFNELRRLMPDISHKMLTATLRGLERDGLICRQVYPEVPPRVEYSISGHGRTAQALIEAVRAWGHVHLAFVDAREAATPSSPATPSVPAAARPTVRG